MLLPVITSGLQLLYLGRPQAWLPLCCGNEVERQDFGVVACRVTATKLPPAKTKASPSTMLFDGKQL